MDRIRLSQLADELDGIVPRVMQEGLYFAAGQDGNWTPFDTAGRMIADAVAAGGLQGTDFAEFRSAVRIVVESPRPTWTDVLDAAARLVPMELPDDHKPGWLFGIRFVAAQVRCELAAPPPAEIAGNDDPSPWVPANTLWPAHFTTNKELNKFRKQHPEMFRNPSEFKLEIHAGQWARYWTARDKSGFDALDGELPSVADDPNVQDDVLAAAAQRMIALREKKQHGKR